jgi:peroxiredoxin
MRTHTTLLLLTAACLTGSVVHAGQADVGKKVENVRLTGLDGKPFALADLKDKDAVVAVFLSFDCPVSTSYLPALAELARTYGPRKVAFLGILATDEDAAALRKQAGEYEVSFPLFRDDRFQAARALQARHVPEAFVLDRGLVLRYRGRIDDSFAARLKKKRSTASHDLRAALDELLAGKPVSVPATEAIGCLIQYPRARTTTGKVTYYRDVLPILQKNCQQCHRPGEVGPFSLMTYKQAVNWADDIKDYTKSRKMPPWKPVEGAEFVGERKLTPKEIDTLAAWVAEGTPEGEPKDAPPLPARVAEGWQLGKPDLILDPGEDMTIGATGRDVFRCFVLPTNLPEDKFVIAYEVRPGNRRVVHHTLHLLDTRGRARRLATREKERIKEPTEKDRGPGYSWRMGVGFFPPDGDVGGWAPGLGPRYLTKGVGFYLPKGSDIVMQVHYHRTGRVEKDRTRVGLYFAKKPANPLQGLAVPARFLVIPAGVEKFPVKGSVWLAQDCTLHTVTPHMHLLGKSIKVTMASPGGRTTTLVAIADWDFNWQETYFFKKPIEAKAGTRLTVEGTYDNSLNNPLNPFNPPRTVFVGEETTNEMCFGFLGVTTPDGKAAGVRLSPSGFVIRRPGVLPRLGMP